MDSGTTKILVELHPEKLRSFKTEIITFPSYPENIQAVKDGIEEYCSIPACVQRIFYQNSEVPDRSSLEQLYIRSEDTLKVYYPIEGETRDVKDVIQWMQVLTDKFKGILEKKDKGENTISYDPIYSSTSADVLMRTLFSPWSDPVKHVNAEHFCILQGVELLANLHRQILDLKKCSTPSRVIHYLEFVFVAASTNFSLSKSCTRRLLQCGGLENCIATFLMMPADEASLLINNQIATIKIAMNAILNFSEIPEIQKSLSSRSDVIKQCFAAANVATVTPSDTPLDVLIFLVCLSRYKDAHENLLKPELLGNISDLCKKNEELLDPIKINALKTYTGVFFAQIICGSTHLLQKLPLSTLVEIKSLIEQVSSFNPLDLRKYEVEDGVRWMSFLNCMDYLYSPLSTEASDEFTDSVVIKELYHLGVGILLHYLQSALGRCDHMETIAEENLTDFVIALPWNVSSHEDRAKCVVKELAKTYPIQPLSLSSLAKAKLAKSTWGLTKFMEIDSCFELLS